MEILTERQRKILSILDNVYPNSMAKDDLLKKLGDNADNILPDVKLLEENQLINAIYGINDTFPGKLTIKPTGKEKLKENIMTRIKESSHKNPLVVFSIILTLIFGITAFYLNFQNMQLEKEKALLEKPLLITPDIRAQGNSLADLRFIVKNPSHSLDYYYISGSCQPDVPELFLQPPPDKNVKQSDTPNRPDAPMMIQPTQNSGILIPAGGEITLSCNNNFVQNVNKDLITSLGVCVNIRNLPQIICNRMQVTILKT